MFNSAAVRQAEVMEAFSLMVYRPILLHNAYANEYETAASGDLCQPKLRDTETDISNQQIQ